MQSLCGVRLPAQSKQLVRVGGCDKGIEGCIKYRTPKAIGTIRGHHKHPRMPLNTITTKYPQELFYHVLESLW
jgi:hypothetical protein